MHLQESYEEEVFFTSGLRKWTGLPKPKTQWLAWKGILGDFCWAFVRLFGVLLAALGARISIPTEHGSVGIEFWVGFGLMLGHLEGMLGLCWAYVRPLLAHLGVCWRLSGLTFQSQRKHGSVGIEFWVSFGLMLGHLEAMLGVCWNIRRCWNQIWQPT